MTSAIGNRTGQRFGKYQLKHLIGQGGFAEVYLGEHLSLKTQKAVKVLQTQLGKEDQESFLSEAQTIARLKHPNTLPLLEFGVEEGTPYLVMDYVANGSLRDRYRTQAFPSPMSVLPHIKQVASALEYAHRERILHRDVKPENMLLGAHDEILLSDFGMVLGTQSSRTQNMDEVAGSSTYMAPELLQGWPVPASDQYALGIVLYELLSGDSPFRGTFTEIASQKIMAQPPMMKAPGVSPEVEAVIIRALAKRPEQRFESMQAFVDAFEQATMEVGETFRASSGWLPPGAYQHLPTVPSIGNQATLRESAPPTSAQAPTVSEESPLPQPKPLPHNKGLARGLAIALLVLAALVAISGLVIAYASFRTNQSGTPSQRQVVSRSQLPAPGTWQNKYEQVTSRKTFFADPLSQNVNGWDTAASQSRSCLFKEGAYHASSLTPYTFGLCSNSVTNDFHDIGYQVQMTILSGNEGGLVFRLTSPTKTQVQAYLFTINRDGSYTLWAVSSQIKILLHRSSPTIKTQLNQINLLGVIAQGKQIALYINKQYVASIVDDTAIHGNIGLLARGWSDPTVVAFSNLAVWRL